MTRAILHWSTALCLAIFCTTAAAGRVLTAEPHRQITAGTDTLTTTEVILARFGDGDLMSFRQWAAQKIMYPVEAAMNGESGEVLAEFVVDKTGTVTDVKILESPGPLLAGEITRVILSSPRWTPQMEDGVPTAVAFRLSFNFAIGAPSLSMLENLPESRDFVIQTTDGATFSAKEGPRFHGGTPNQFKRWVVAKTKTLFERGVRMMGRVIVNFSIGTDGKISRIEVVETSSPELAELVVRAIEASPKWKPATLNKQPVEIRIMDLTIDFDSIF